jgi:hypothetical protein
MKMDDAISLGPRHLRAFDTTADEQVAHRLCRLETAARDASTDLPQTGDSRNRRTRTRVHCQSGQTNK